jgi:hypothetical protein
MESESNENSLYEQSMQNIMREWDTMRGKANIKNERKKYTKRNESDMENTMMHLKEKRSQVTKRIHAMQEKIAYTIYKQEFKNRMRHESNQ